MCKQIGTDMKRILILLLILACSPVWAVCEFRKDTASQTFLIGPFLDATDGVTAETGLTIANTDIRISKGGGNMAAKNSGGGTHDEEGLYQITLDATDTNTAGSLLISVQDAAHVPVWHECVVYAAAYFDLLDGTTALMTSTGGGLALGPVDITTVTSQTVFVLPSGATNDDAYLYQTVYIKAGTEDCFDKYVTNYVGSTKTLTIDSACANVTVAANDDLYVRAGASAKALQGLITSVAALNDLSPTDVNAQVDIALQDADLDHVMQSATEMTTDIITGNVLAASAVDEFWAKIIETAGATYTAECALAIGLAESAGTFTTAGNVRTYKDPSGATDRIVGTISGTTRSGITVSCP